MNANKISIITPAYDAQPFIARCVSSVLDQTYGNWEMLIVAADDEDYERVLAEHGIRDRRLRFLQSPDTDSGPSTARNVALQHAYGNYIAPLDADDLFYPDRLERLLSLAGSWGMAGDNVLVVDDQTHQPINIPFETRAFYHYLDPETYVDIAAPLTFLFRRDVIDAPWDDLSMGADALFNLRAMENASSVPVISDYLHEYRVRADSVCHSSDAHTRAEVAYSRALVELDIHGLGFKTVRYRALVKQMLTDKLRLNQRFSEAYEQGLCENFQQFLSLQPHSRQRQYASRSIWR